MFSCILDVRATGAAEAIPDEHVEHATHAERISGFQGTVKNEAQAGRNNPLNCTPIKS